MIAFKTFVDCPVENKPAGVPDNYPWQIITIADADKMTYEGQGFTVMVDAEYHDYLDNRQAEFALWAVENNYGDNPQKLLTDIKADQGFDLYRSLISLLDAGGGISSVDTGLQVYEAITPLRNMLKDGFFTYALRHYCKVIKPMEMFPVEIDTYFISSVRAICKIYGSTDSELDNIETGENA